jgi:Tol biopolymer transport system component
VLFCRADTSFEHYEIYETRRGPDGRWSAPVMPSFARSWSNADPHFTPDGRSVFFISNRPDAGGSTARDVHHIWVVDLASNGEWGTPRYLGPPVNLPGVDAWSPSVAANGNLYWGADRPGTLGGNDLWMSRRVGDGYGAPENLGPAINTAGQEVEPWISPDERYLIFSALSRSDSLGSYDLYLSRRVAGRWEPARRLGEGINSTARDFNQSVSPDGAWLYFSSTRRFDGALGERFDVPRDDSQVKGIGNGLGDIYRVPMRALGL